MKFKWSVENSIPILAFILCLVLSALAVSASNTFQVASEKQGGFARAMFLNYFVQTFIIISSYYLYYYVHHHWLFRKLLKKKGLAFYLLGLAALMIIVPPLHNMLLKLLPVIDGLMLHTLAYNSNVFHTFNYSFALSVLALTFPLILIVEWYSQQHKYNLLEKEKSAVELNMLKQQINPHFFFNTLNNLYAMSLTKDDATPETILKLSDLMRFVIYKGKEEKVKLKDELKYLQDYLDLQMIRLHKKVDLKFETQLEDSNVELAPLLFIILLENAFKHGIEPAENDSFLHLSLIQKGTSIEFTCSNSLEDQTENKTKGIGIENLKRRLELIYPKQHSLEFSPEKNSHKVKLRLSL